MSQGVYVPGGICPRGYYVLGVSVRGYKSRGVIVLEPYLCIGW